MNTLDYIDFLRTKIPTAEIAGFEPISAPHSSLKPHQTEICLWGVRGGRRAIFASFGLGKTRMHLQIAKWVSEKTGGRFLIVAPLGVRQEFTENDGPAMGIPVHFVRTTEEVLAIKGRVFITNYESVRDGKIDLSLFDGAGLDESSVLRSYGSKTYQAFIPMFRQIPYRYVFTATPAPNRYKELTHYAGFLGIMDTGEALTRFFQRDSSNAGNLTLYPHMELQFWNWLASWATFIRLPSDLGYDDTGYDLPEIHVTWHRLEVDHTKAWQTADSWGQHMLFLDQSQGLVEAAETKRDSVATRVEHARRITAEASYQAPEPLTLAHQVIDKAFNFVQNQYVIRELKAGKTWGDAFGVGGCSIPVYWDADSKGIHVITDDGTDGGDRFTIKPKEILARLADWQPVHWLIWHDLEAERHAIEKTFPAAITAYGSQDLDERENLILGFSRGEFPILATKPSIAGSGCNFQRHCHRAIFLGVGFKFNDFLQAIHRIHRFGQTRAVEIHIIHLASEDTIVAQLQDKWRRHTELVARMTALLRKFRLSTDPMKLIRSLVTGSDSVEAAGPRFRSIHNDCVLALQEMEENSVHHICTSIPFGNQYEYSPSFNDFGHNSGDDPFFQQMDYLVPHLLRVLQPGRIAAIHVKDRIQFGSVTGTSFPTVNPFSDKTVSCFLKHGFHLMARITIDTDVVRENNQTYRLGWSENAKDGSKMGAGMPEYVLVFRKLPSDQSNGYADVPVTKPKESYTRADWQIDAAGLWRSDGNRLPDPDIMKHMSPEDIKRLWIDHCNRAPYSHETHVELCRALEGIGKLPSSFMLFPPISRNPDVWTDIVRMRTLNSEQSRRNEEKHVCPLQLDIIRRLLTRYTLPDEIVLDPFGGIGSVPYEAIRMGRIGWSVELNAEYWRCNAGYCEAAQNEVAVPTLFDLQPTEGQAA